MREYGNVWSSFWTGDTGRHLRGCPEAQIVALYLVTGPTASWIGLYHMPLTLIAHHTGLTQEGASKGLRRAIEGGFCQYDESREEVFVTEMASYQIGDTLETNDKRRAGVIREWQNAKKSLFYRAFYDRYGKAYGLPKPSPIEGASKPHRSQKLGQEQETKQEHEHSSPADKPPGGAGRKRDELFDAIAEVTGADPKVNASHIGKVKKTLLAFEPPMTPAEIRTFPAVLAAQGWTVAASLNVLESKASWIRTPPAKPSARPPPAAGKDRMSGHVELFGDNTDGPRTSAATVGIRPDNGLPSGVQPGP